jgi:hypothetical protein
LPGEAISVSYEVTLSTALLAGPLVLPGTPLTTTVVFRDDTHRISFDQSAAVRVGAPSLSLSGFTVPSPIRSNAPLTVTVTAFNSGQAPALAARVTVLPPWGWAPITGVTGWQGRLDVGQSVTLTHQVTAPDTSSGVSMLTEVLLWDGAGGAWERVAWVKVEPYQAYLPLVFKQ